MPDLLRALEAFLQEHRRCGDLDGGVKGDRVWMACDRAPAVLLSVRRLSDDGLKAWQQVVEHGYEGLLAKDPASPYIGGRSLKRLKVKQSHYREGERGWEPKR
jgi:ATP-dependent DNA ligase